MMTLLSLRDRDARTRLRLVGTRRANLEVRRLLTAEMQQFIPRCVREKLKSGILALGCAEIDT